MHVSPGCLLPYSSAVNSGYLDSRSLARGAPGPASQRARAARCREACRRQLRPGDCVGTCPEIRAVCAVACHSPRVSKHCSHAVYPECQ